MTDKFTRIVYEVIQDADVIIEVLDARDPLGTRSPKLEKIIQNYPDKKLILFLNKADLVPYKIIKEWIRYLSKEYPTFYGSDRFGYKRTITFLKRKITKLMDKTPIRVCLVGYPNVGKSSIINALRKKKVAPVSPLAGFTRGKKYIKLESVNILLMDTPGIIPYKSENELELVIKGAIRPDKISDVQSAIEKIFSLVKKEDLEKIYNIKFESIEQFLSDLAKKRGRLLPKGIPDIDTISRIIIKDFQRGKIPYYKKPPN